MIGRTNVASGGAAELNFVVVGGTTQPSNPKENTIWVDTSTEITSYVFASSEPSSPSAGMVWFLTGASSSVAFAATEENVIMLYPNACKQYVGGAWVDKTAVSYIGGEWVSWILYLYTPGDVHTDVTGGYETKAIRYSSTWDGNAVDAKAPSVSQGSESMIASITTDNSRNYSGSVLTANKIDLSGFNTVRFNVLLSFGNGGNHVKFYVSGSNTEYSPSVEVTSSGNGEKTVELDVSSLSGEYYVGFNILAGSGGNVTTSVTVYNIVAE